MKYFIPLSLAALVLAENDEDNPCCLNGHDSDDCQQMLLTGYSPRCLADTDMDKSSNKQCPDFCKMKPNDWSCCGSAERGEREKHFIPYGPNHGDIMSTSKSLGTHMGPIQFTMGNFLGIPGNYIYLSSHGYIRVSENILQSPPYDYYNYYRTISGEKTTGGSKWATIAPFWADFNVGDPMYSGSFGYRILEGQELSQLKHHGYEKPAKSHILRVLVATWKKMVPTTSYGNDGTQRDRTNTFQVLIAADDQGDVRLSFNYGDIEQATYMYTGGDACGEHGNHYASIGIAGPNGIWEHPYSNTEKADEVDDTTNVDRVGRINVPIKNGRVTFSDKHKFDFVPEVKGIPISTKKSGLTDAMIYGIKNPKVLEHGCHCAAIGSPDYDMVGGPYAVDMVDELCKQWKALRACLSKSEGACHNEKSTYGVSNNFDKCYNKGTCCASQTCTVDTYMLEKINAATKGNWKPKLDQSMCYPGPADHQHDSCCGVAPNLFSFNSGQRMCVDGVLM